MPPADSDGAGIEEREVIAALGRVNDPQLHESLVVLNMVKSIEIDGRAVRLEIALPAPGQAHQSRLDVDIKGELLPLGVEDVEIAFVPMSDRDREALQARLHGAGTAAAGMHGPAAPASPGGPASPFEELPSPLMALEGDTRIIAISSGKGGVGKSSLTANLAVALSQLGKRVAVIDADVYGFSIPKMLGIDQEPSVENERISPPEAEGVKVVSMGFFIEEDQAVVWRGPMLHKALEQFITDVEWGEPEFLLIDMPPGTGDISLSVSQFLPRAEVVVVTTPQPAAQRVAQRAAAMARKVDMSVIGVIENMSWFTGDDKKRYEIFGEGGGEALAADLGVPLLGRVPIEDGLRTGSDLGKPVVAASPDSEASVAIREIAERLMELKPRRIRKAALSVSGGPSSPSPQPAPPPPAKPSGLPGLQVTPKRSG